MRRQEKHLAINRVFSSKLGFSKCFALSFYMSLFLSIILTHIIAL